MTLTEEEINQHKKLLEKVNELSQEKSSIIATGKAKREQALEILKNYGLAELKDISKLQEKLDDLEEKIKQEHLSAEEEIKEINELIENVDNISVK